MPRAKPEARKRKLEEKQARINAELHRLDAREREAERKRATRRQFLVGAMVLDRIERGEGAERMFLGDMDRFLDRDRDRALFDLPPPLPARRRAHALRAEGKSLRRIAEILAAEGVPLPPGRGKKWHHKAVARMFQRFEDLTAAPAPASAPKKGRGGLKQTEASS